MGVIHPEDANALVNPEADDASQFLPELLPAVRFKVERIDILILLRWVFGILNASVRTVAEPLRVFLHVGVIWRALISQV